MGRTVAVVWHASFSIAAGVVYFFFVLPRWPELLGDTLPHAWHRAAHRHRRPDRPCRAACGVHAAAHPPAGVRHTCAGAETAYVVDRAARVGRCADHRHRDQRDLALHRQRGSVAVRHLRCRRRDRPARHLRVLPGVCGRTAAASAQTAEAQEGQAEPRPPKAEKRSPKRPPTTRRTMWATKEDQAEDSSESEDKPPR